MGSAHQPIRHKVGRYLLFIPIRAALLVHDQLVVLYQAEIEHPNADNGDKISFAVLIFKNLPKSKKRSKPKYIHKIIHQAKQKCAQEDAGTR